MRPLLAILLATALCALALLAGRTTPVPAYQHIANGGFEDGTDGWSVGGGTLGLADGAEGPVWEGDHAGMVTIGAAGTARLRYQLTAALAEGSYEVQAYVRTDTAATVRSMVQLQTEDGTLNFDAGMESVGESWTSVPGSVAIDGPGSAAVVIAVTGEPGVVVYLDAVTLDGTPPATASPTSMPATSSAVPGTPTPAATLTASPSPTPTMTPRVDVIAPALRNGGFEDETADGLPFAWLKQGGTLSADRRARSGARAAVLVSDTDSTKWIHQAVAVDGSAWYEFSAHILDDDPAVAAVSLRVAWYASDDGSGAQIDTHDSTERLTAPSSGYRQLTTGSVQAPPNARSARVRVLLTPASSARARIWIDDAWFGEAAAIVPTETATVAIAAQSNDATPTSAETKPGRSGRATSRVAGAAQTSGATGARIVINEVLYDPDGDGTDADGEWVELYNASDVAVSLAGWIIADGRGADALSDISIEPRGFAIVASSEAFTAAYPKVRAPAAIVGGRIGNGLDNNGDVLVLIDPAGAFVDAVSWGDDDAAMSPPVDDVGAGHSIERTTAGMDRDAAADWVDNDRPTPGEAYRPRQASPGASAGRVDVLAGAAGHGFRWVPWLAAGASLAALAATAAWRGIETIRARQP